MLLPTLAKCVQQVLIAAIFHAQSSVFQVSGAPNAHLMTTAFSTTHSTPFALITSATTFKNARLAHIKQLGTSANNATKLARLAKITRPSIAALALLILSLFKGNALKSALVLHSGRKLTRLNV